MREPLACLARSDGGAARAADRLELWYGRAMLRSSVLLLGVLGLACAGGKGKTDPDDEGGGGSQSQACADYLACAAEVDPATFATLGSTYGPDGDCWTQGDAYADTCTAACEAAVEALATAYPEAEACAGYVQPVCPIVSGTYDLTLLDPDGGNCELGGEVFGQADVVCEAPETGQFTLHWEDVFAEQADLDCTFTGSDFTCAGTWDVGVPADLSLDGQARGGGADGRYVVDIPDFCSGEGNFDLE